MKKVFFTDLDGTLLTTDKHISKKTRDAVDAWLEAGNILAISSGRPLPSVKEVMNDNNLIGENIFGIAFNGGQILNSATNEIVLSKTLPLDICFKIASMAKENDVYCHTYDDTHILIPREDKEIKFYQRTIHIPAKVLPNFPEGIVSRPCKFLCVDPDKEHDLDDFAIKVMNEFPGIVTCVKSNPYLLEVFPGDSGKGRAVSEFCEMMGIDISNSFAAGDELNDMSMLEAAGTGIAMINGNPLLKEKADVITTLDNDNDGLYHFFIDNI